MSLCAIFFTVYPIIAVPSPLIFGAKVAAVTIIANAIGLAIYLVANRRRRKAPNLECILHSSFQGVQSNLNAFCIQV